MKLDLRCDLGIHFSGHNPTLLNPLAALQVGIHIPVTKEANWHSTAKYCCLPIDVRKPTGFNPHGAKPKADEISKNKPFRNSVKRAVSVSAALAQLQNAAATIQ